MLAKISMSSIYRLAALALEPRPMIGTAGGDGGGDGCWAASGVSCAKAGARTARRGTLTGVAGA